MKKELSKLKKGKLFLLLGASLAAGILNAMLGTGGGIILIYALSHVFKEKQNRDIFALSLCAVFVMTLLSAALYGIGGRFTLRDFLPLIIPSLAGGALGSFLLTKIKGKVLKRIFSVLLIISGILILIR